MIAIQMHASYENGPVVTTIENRKACLRQQTTGGKGALDRPACSPISDKPSTHRRKVLLCGLNMAHVDATGLWHWSPLAPPVLVSYLQAQPELSAEYEFHFLDFRHEQTDEAIVSAVRASAPWLVGWSTYVWNIERVLPLSRWLKAGKPDLRVILGGPHVSDPSVAEWILQENPAVDAVVRGEGEIPLADLLRRLMTPTGNWEVPGITCRDSSREPVSFPSAPVLERLEGALSPYLSGVYPLDDPDGVFVSLQSSRGCRFACAYCAWGRTRVREFPREVVLEELERVLSASRLRGGFFIDADFFEDDAKACATLERLAERAPQACWFMEGDPTRVSERALALLSRLSNCHVCFGLQSISPEALRFAGRPFTDLNEFAQCVRRVIQRAPALDVRVGIICGLPGDTPETFRDTLEFALGINPTFLWSSLLIPLPGTPFLREAKRYGIEHGGPPTFRLLATSTFPRHELERAVRLSAFISLCFEFPALQVAAKSVGIRRGGLRPLVSVYEALEQRMEAQELAGDSFPLSPMANMDLYILLRERYARRKNIAALYRALLSEAGWDLPPDSLSALAEFIEDIEERFSPTADLRQVDRWQLERSGRSAAPFLPGIVE